ncbi:MAG: damage-inducible protein [Alphaproteobacteria bacterium]|nr:damage-inducible protein [Alphaproteobacteria bacterium]
MRARLRQIEQPVRHGVLPFGVAAIDRALPGGGLALGAVHEFLGADADEEDSTAPAAFTAALLARLDCNLVSSPALPGKSTPSPPAGRGERGKSGAAPPSCRRPCGTEPSAIYSPPPASSGTGTVLWCLSRPDLYGPGLAEYGLAPARLVLVAGRRDEDILWAMEEGLRAGASSGLAAVVGEIESLPMVASRRLQLAAERTGIPAFMLRRWHTGTAAAKERGRPSAAATRWRIAAMPARALPGEPGIGRPRWRVELLRCRGGGTGSWEVEAPDATGLVSLPAELADRPAPLREGAAGQPRRRAG